MRDFPAARGLVPAALLVLTAGGAHAQPAAPVIRFTDTTLPNGLRVLISEDRSAPVYSLAVHYKVGSRDERPGRTGFAHLFEHMMYKGSENIGPGEHFMLVFNNGGSMNGTTNKDRTLYFETLPSNQLDLGLFLEADRMRSLAITRENLDNQRHAVQEERRLGVDNQPYGRTDELIDELAYDNPAYEHSVIGSMPTSTPPPSTTWRRSSAPTTRRTMPCWPSSAMSTPPPRSTRCARPSARFLDSRRRRRST